MLKSSLNFELSILQNWIFHECVTQKASQHYGNMAQKCHSHGICLFLENVERRTYHEKPTKEVLNGYYQVLKLHRKNAFFNWCLFFSLQWFYSAPPYSHRIEFKT